MKDIRALEGTAIGCWNLEKYLASGAFAGVFVGSHMNDTKKKYAIKVAAIKPKKKGSRANTEVDPSSLLYWEYTLYKNFFRNHPNIPKIPEYPLTAYAKNLEFA